MASIEPVMTPLNSGPATIPFRAPELPGVTLDIRAVNADLPEGNDLHQCWMRAFAADSRARIDQHPEFVLQQMDELAQAGDDSHSWIVRGTFDDGGEVLAVLLPKQIPLKRVGGYGFSTRLRGYRLVGNRLLGQTDDPRADEVVAAVAQLMQQQRWEFLLVEDLERDSSLWNALHFYRQDGFHVYSPTGMQRRLRIRLPDDPAEYWSSFSKNARKKFRRGMKRLGDSRLLRVTEEHQVAEFLQHARKVSENSWQTKQFGLRVPGDEADHRKLSLLARMGALRSYVLLCEERPIAFELDTQFNGLLDSDEAAYDRHEAELSPGKLLLVRVLEDLIEENPPEWFDFGIGDAEYKRLFANHETEAAGVWLVPPGWRSRSVVGYLKLCRRLRQSARGALARTGLLPRARQLLRGVRRQESS